MTDSVRRMSGVDVYPATDRPAVSAMWVVNDKQRLTAIGVDLSGLGGTQIQGAVERAQDALASFYRRGEDRRPDGRWGSDTQKAWRRFISAHPMPKEFKDPLDWLAFMKARNFAPFDAAELRPPADSAPELHRPGLPAPSARTAPPRTVPSDDPAVAKVVRRDGFGLYSLPDAKGLVGIAKSDPVDRTGDLLSYAENFGYASAETPGQLRFRFQVGTYTVQQLQTMYAATPDSPRGEAFTDFLRHNGLTLELFNAIIDDALADPANAGRTVDLRPSCETTRQYGLAAPRADASAGLKLGPEVRPLTLGEACREFFAELLAGLSPKGGNPTTRLFNAKEVWQQAGGDFVRCLNTEARADLVATFATRPGDVEAAIDAQRPAGVSDGHWGQVRQHVLIGMRTELTHAPSDTPDTPLLAAIDDPLLRTQARAFLATHANAEATAVLEQVLRAPPALRGEALMVLRELGPAEQTRLLALLRGNGEMPRPPNPGPEQSTYDAIARFHQLAPDAQRAALATLGKDSLRTPLGAPEVAALIGAAEQASRLPEDARDAYLQLLPAFGLSRAALFDRPDTGVAARLQQCATAPQRTALLRSLADSVGTTSTLRLILARSQFAVRLVDTSTTSLSAEARDALLTRLRSRNVQLRSGEHLLVVDADIGKPGNYRSSPLSLAAYTSDPQYRAWVEQTLGINGAGMANLLVNVSASLDASTDAMVAERARLDARRAELAEDTSLRGVAERTQVERELAMLLPMRNVELDISPGSELHQLFGLDRRGSVRSAAERFATSLLAAGPHFSVQIGGRARSSEAVARALAQPSETERRRAFLSSPDLAGLDYQDTVLLFAYVANRMDALRTTDMQVVFDDIGTPAIDELRLLARDGIDGNLSLGAERFLEASVPSRSTARSQAPAETGQVAAVASANWAQKSVFGIDGGDAGYVISHVTYLRALQRAQAPGTQPSPTHVFGALFGIDDMATLQGVPDEDGAPTRPGYRPNLETGVATGDPAVFAGTKPDAVHVISLSGAGKPEELRGFDATSDRFAEMFRAAGGVPAENLAIHRQPSRAEARDAVLAQIEAMAPGEALVVHFAGHTFSNDDTDEVTGLFFRDGTMAPGEVRELMQAAQQRGVNLLFVSDSCRGGAFVDEARDIQMRALSSTGQIPPAVGALDGLRRSLMDLHLALYQLDRSAVPKGAPTPAQLRQLLSIAMREPAASRGGDGKAMAALEQLATLVDRLPKHTDYALALTLAIDSARAVMRDRATLITDMMRTSDPPLVPWGDAVPKDLSQPDVLVSMFLRARWAGTKGWDAASAQAYSGFMDLAAKLPANTPAPYAANIRALAAHLERDVRAREARTATVLTSMQPILDRIGTFDDNPLRGLPGHETQATCEDSRACMQLVARTLTEGREAHAYQVLLRTADEFRIRLTDPSLKLSERAVTYMRALIELQEAVATQIPAEANLLERIVSSPWVTGYGLPAVETDRTSRAYGLGVMLDLLSEELQARMPATLDASAGSDR